NVQGVTVILAVDRKRTLKLLQSVEDVADIDDVVSGAGVDCQSGPGKRLRPAPGINLSGVENRPRILAGIRIPREADRLGGDTEDGRSTARLRARAGLCQCAGR